MAIYTFTPDNTSVIVSALMHQASEWFDSIESPKRPRMAKKWAKKITAFMMVIEQNFYHQVETGAETIQIVFTDDERVLVLHSLYSFQIASLALDTKFGSYQTDRRIMATEVLEILTRPKTDNG